MKKVSLFEGKVEVGISELEDGRMRYFGDGDESEIINNQRKVGKVIDLDSDRVARIRTVYDGRDTYTTYQEITTGNLSEYCINESEKEIPVTDGLVTRDAEIGILLPLADCLGAVVYDESQKIVGLLHAGRHNIEQNGPGKFIDFLVKEFGCEPRKLKLYFSPYAVNYQITLFDNKTMSEVATKQFLDAGVLLENIIDERIETDGERYPSNSGGDRDKRFAVVVKQK